MPSPDAIPPAPDGYLRRVLRQGSMPFRYRSGVRTLLGMPASGEDAIVGSAGMPPIEFRYAVSPSLAPMAETGLLTAEQWLDAALDDLDSGKEQNPSNPRAAAVGAAPSPRPDSPPAAVASKAAHLQAEVIVGNAAVGAAPSPRLEPAPPAIAPRAALPQVTAVDLVPVNQAGESSLEVPPAQPVGTSSRALQDQEFSIPPTDLTAVSVRTVAAIQPSATWQRADQILEPGQLQRMRPGTVLTHPHATGVATPSQTKALIPEKPLAEADGVDQPTTITIPGVSEPRPVSTTAVTTDRDNSILSGARMVSRMVSENEMDRAQRNPANTSTAAAVGAAPPPRLEPAASPRSGQAPAAVSPRTVRLQVTPDVPPVVGVTASTYQPTSSAMEQIARLQRTVAELTAQVAAQRDFQQRPTPVFHPPVQPVANVERSVPRTGASRAFWERSYINRLYRWSRR
jgi:hypothetical protein